MDFKKKSENCYVYYSNITKSYITLVFAEEDPPGLTENIAMELLKSELRNLEG